MISPSTRAAALAQLDAFLPAAALYGRDRNHVSPGHPSVSRLSATIRHRLITEAEVATAVLGVHSFTRVEKFVQEVYWRRYWKSWLSLRPEVWEDFESSLAQLPADPAARAIEEARSGNSVIDHFSRELTTTGYLHNHARMWFAAWWIHEARLPWQSGAAFFFRHLLDADPASNTLSWRWVAGLQTAGKSYLARRSNLEKYLAPALLETLADGLPAFENPRAHPVGPFVKFAITHPHPAPSDVSQTLRSGLWIHEEDLSPETAPLQNLSFAAIAVTADRDTWRRLSLPDFKTNWLRQALQDSATRAEETWNLAPRVELESSFPEALTRWADSEKLEQIVALRPEIGPLHDALPGLHSALYSRGIRLALIDRPEDLQLRPFATGGFFPFWERLRKSLFSVSDPRENPPAQRLLDFPT